MNAELQICFIEKETDACLKKENKGKHLQQFDKKRRKKNKFVITAGGNGEGLGGTPGSVGACLEPSVALSIPRPSSFTIPSSVPGVGMAFSGAWARAVPDGNNLIWDTTLTNILPLKWFLNLFLRRPYNSRRSSLDMGFKCMKLQKPPRVHSLLKHIKGGGWWNRYIQVSDYKDGYKIHAATRLLLTPKIRKQLIHTSKLIPVFSRENGFYLSAWGTNRGPRATWSCYLTFGMECWTWEGHQIKVLLTQTEGQTISLTSLIINLPFANSPLNQIANFLLTKVSFFDNYNTWLSGHGSLSTQQLF